MVRRLFIELRYVNKDTHEFAHSLLETLRDEFFEGGRLDERRFQKHAPPNHYGATCFSVASFRAYDDTGDERFYEAGEQTLSRFFGLPDDERGHAEFNSFALLEAVEDARNGRYELPVSERLIADQIEYSTSRTTPNGNNWLLLQALCRLKYADLFDDERERRRATKLLEFSYRWILSDGVVADKPGYRLAPMQTPLTYHAKLCMLFGRFADRLSDQHLADEAEAQAGALARLALPNGECLYFGRSENTIFGYANAIDALSRLEETRRSPPAWSTVTKRAVANFFLTRFDSGRGNCQPGHFSVDDARLDNYIYDTVYASYAAMLLLGLPAISPESLGEPRRSKPALEYEHLPHAGLLAASGAQSALGVATDGQIHFRNSEPDLRYAGLIPQTFTYRGESVCPGIPVEIDDSEGLPFLPVIHREGRRYAPVCWDATVLERDSRLTIRGDGEFHRFKPVAGSERGETDDADSLPDRLKELIKRHETTRRTAERAIRAFRDAFRLSRLDIVHLNYRTRPEPIPARTSRSLHYLPQSDVLVVQTVTSSAEGILVRPSSVVVSPEHERSLEIAYSVGTSIRKDDVSTHKGDGRWHVPEARSDSSPTWSVVALDPDDRVTRSESSVDDGALVTNLRLGGERRTLRTPLSTGK